MQRQHYNAQRQQQALMFRAVYTGMAKNVDTDIKVEVEKTTDEDKM